MIQSGRRIQHIPAAVSDAVLSARKIAHYFCRFLILDSLHLKLIFDGCVM
jgi:hypothetical protein